MKPWPSIGSTAGSSRVPGDQYLPTDGRRQEFTRQHRATAGPTDTSRRPCHTAQTGRFSARTSRVPAGTLPPISIVAASLERARSPKRSGNSS
jgi:hypothetical protein